MKTIPWHRGLGLILTAAAMIQAPSASALVVGTSTDNLDGTFTYSYTVNNSAGTFDVFQWALDFDFLTPDWDQLDVFSGGDVSVPDAGWFADAGIPVSGLSAQDFFTLAEDVLAGDVLPGFSFTSSFVPGTVGFHEFSALGESASGFTVGPVPLVASVPDSGSGLAGIGLLCLLTLWGARPRSMASLPVA